MKYEVILNNQTSSEQILSQKALWIISIPFELNTHDEDKFQAFLKRMELSTVYFDSCITGELNKFNFQIIKCPSEYSAEQMATKQQETWINTHYHKLNILKNHGKCMLSTEFTTQNDFNSCLSYVTDLYNTRDNTKFKALILRVVGDRMCYLSNLSLKQQINDLNIDTHALIDLLTSYILYECAIVLYIRTLNYDSIFYMGKMNPPTIYIADLECPNFLKEPFKKLSTFHVSQFKNNDDKVSRIQKSKIKKNQKIFCENKSSSKTNILNIVFSEFFNSTTISVKDKINFIERFSEKNNSNLLNFKKLLEESLT